MATSFTPNEKENAYNSINNDNNNNNNNDPPKKRETSSCLRATRSVSLDMSITWRSIAHALTRTHTHAHTQAA